MKPSSPRMVIRPRLWRLGAVVIYIIRMAPLAAIAIRNIHIGFVKPFLQMQKRENWTRYKY